jgi:hypothetical protein
MEKVIQNFIKTHNPEVAYFAPIEVSIKTHCEPERRRMALTYVLRLGFHLRAGKAHGCLRRGRKGPL